MKLQVFKLAVVTVLLYGCETWALTKKLESELNSFGTSSLRIILGVKKLDKVPNAITYENSGEKPMILSVRERQLRHLGHILRLNDNEPAKKFALYEAAHGSRRQERPKLNFVQ